jgi:Flp pilus assembly pilin Flp
MLRVLIQRFWQDDRGAFLNTAELIFLGTILAIGVIPGVAALRDAIVTEFADMAAAVNPRRNGNNANGNSGNANGIGNGNGFGNGNGVGNGNGLGNGFAYGINGSGEGERIATAADYFQ